MECVSGKMSLGKDEVGRSEHKQSKNEPHEKWKKKDSKNNKTPENTNNWEKGC